MKHRKVRTIIHLDPGGKMTKYYKQPDFMGGKKVKAIDVPNNYYTIAFDESDPNEKEDVIVNKHENNMCMTKDQIKSGFNMFSTKKDATTAASKVIKAMKGR